MLFNLKLALSREGDQYFVAKSVAVVDKARVNKIFSAPYVGKEKLID